MMMGATNQLMNPPHIFQSIRQSRYLLLSLPGPHGHQSTGDGHHYQCPPPQLDEIPRGPKLGEGGGPQTHRQPHLLPITRGHAAPHHTTEG